MDLRISISMFVILAFSPTNGFIICNEMSFYSEDIKGKLCTLSNIGEKSFYNNDFYSDGIRNSIETLRITSKLADIPEYTRARFTRVKALDLSYSGLIELRRSSFDRVPTSVKILQMTNCEFKSLFQQMFTSIPGLVSLNMSQGAIDDINDKAFANLINLTHLDLAGNRFKAITMAMFTELPSLLYLDLSSNRLSGAFETGLLSGCVKLTWLSLKNNQLTTLEDGFVSSKTMLYLILSNNSISYFNSRSIEVKYLYVQKNVLKEIFLHSSTLVLEAADNNITELGCDETLSLQVLKLAGNSISSLECIGKASNLTNLDLRDSNIGPLNHSTFAMLTELKELRLGHTNITNFVLGVLSHQEKLEVLDLSYNKLGSFSLDILLAAKNLKELYIDGNEMMNIPYQKIDEIFHSLQVLGIGDNIFDCSNLAEIFRYFSKRELRIVASSDKVIHSTNIKGIGCTMSNSSLLPVVLPVANSSDFSIIVESIKTVQENFRKVEAQVDQMVVEMKAKQLSFELNKFNSSDSRLWTLVSQLNNVTLERQELSNSIQGQKINQTMSELEALRKEIKDFRGMPTSDASDISLLKNLMLIILTAAISFICLKVYKKLKTTPRAAFNSRTTLNTNIEMNDN